MENFGVGSDAGLPDDVRFRAGVIRLIANRLSHRPTSSEALPPAIFLLLPERPEVVEGVQLRTEPMLDNGVASVEGCIWFVGPVVGKGVGFEVAADAFGWSDDAAFRIATEQLGVGDVPAIVFETRTPQPEARFYPRGLGDPDEYELLRLGGNPISLTEVFEVIEDVYRDGLVTPDAHGIVGDLWAKPGKHWVATKAEARIQFYLRIALRRSFPACRVLSEQPQATGRFDLELEEIDQGDKSIIIRHGLLELKVLRSFWSSGGSVTDEQTREWVTEGVRQAAAYRDERNVRAAALCCFDMRKSMTIDCFAHVRNVARRRKVALRSWRMYATAKAYRAVLEAEALA